MRTRWISKTLKPPFSYSAKCRIPISPNPVPEKRNFGFAFNYVDISRLLSVCGRERYLRLGCSLHASIIKNSEYFDLNTSQYDLRNLLVVWNSILSMYLKCGNLSDAVKLFGNMPLKDPVSWNSVISGFLRVGEFGMGFGYFKQMYELGISRIDQATLTTVLSAFDEPNLLYGCWMIHALVFLNGYEQEVSVGNALITSYFKCERLGSGRQVFDEMIGKNVITWTAMISGLAQNQFYDESLSLFQSMRHGLIEPNSLTYLSLLLACSGLQVLSEGRQIHGLVLKSGMHPDLCIESALMDMYSKCGSMEDACQIFESAEELDEVSMTVILAGLAQNGLETEAIELFAKIVNMGVETDPNMVSAVLGVFGVGTSLALGKQVHSLIVKRSFGSNPFVSNGLINMYSKCGDLDDSIKVFNQMPERNSISWNSMIAAFARHGNGSRALQLYKEMTVEGAEPTDVTFLSLLHACSHVGSIAKGMEFLEIMVKVHGIHPRMEHYACIVDMLGRAGCLKEAKSFIEGLPVEPGVLLWQTLLGACSIHGDSEMAKDAANHLLLAAPENPTPYILMANIYSTEGKWTERARIIKRMKEMGVTRDIGTSWIEVHKEIHSFLVDDRIHPKAEIIHKVLAELIALMRDEGYVPDQRYLLNDLD